VNQHVRTFCSLLQDPAASQLCIPAIGRCLIGLTAAIQIPQKPLTIFKARIMLPLKIGNVIIEN
jgi:hypothetical protein